jgi:pimeloyl-ACP methyl ester carboxylesterase
MNASAGLIEDLHVVHSGPPSAPTVVLVHGSGGSIAWWDQVLPGLQDLHVVRVDLLGHGGSASPTDGYGMAEQARRIGDVLDRLEVRRAILVGHSTGGNVVTALAEQRPELVAAIALVDTGPRADAFIGGSPISRLLFAPVLGSWIWRLSTDDMIRRALASAFTVEVVIPGRIVADVKGMTYRSITATLRASLAFLKERQVPDRLAELGLPLLVVFGSRDRRWQPSSAEDYRRVPNARIEILGGVGHTPMIEDPDTTAELLRSFALDPAVFAHRDARN